MIAVTTVGDARHSNALARARDNNIEWLLDTHPVTADMLVGLGWFPTRAKARVRLRRLTAKKRIRFVGTICRKGGRPEHVYCRWLPKLGGLVHEVELTELCFRLDAATILRGPHVIDDDIQPDAEVRIKGHLYYLELDRGTMGYAQMARRFERYEGFEDLVLWVCPTAARREGLRQRAEPLRSVALFTTLPEALDSPHKPIWIDYAGNRTSLPREG